VGNKHTPFTKNAKQNLQLPVIYSHVENHLPLIVFMEIPECVCESGEFDTVVLCDPVEGYIERGGAIASGDGTGADLVGDRPRCSH
jgi:hypothetical protein